MELLSLVFLTCRSGPFSSAKQNTERMLTKKNFVPNKAFSHLFVLSIPNCNLPLVASVSFAPAVTSLINVHPPESCVH